MSDNEDQRKQEEIFQDQVYRGLYGGMNAKDIHAHKGLKKTQKIQDYMGGAELAANLFCITQTDESIKRKGICDEQQVNDEHHRIGHQVREFMLQNSGTAPENFPTPTKSLQQRQLEAEQFLIESEQQSLLPEFLSEDL